MYICKCTFDVHVHSSPLFHSNELLLKPYYSFVVRTFGKATIVVLKEFKIFLLNTNANHKKKFVLFIISRKSFYYITHSINLVTSYHTVQVLMNILVRYSHTLTEFILSMMYQVKLIKNNYKVTTKTYRLNKNWR